MIRLLGQIFTKKANNKFFPGTWDLRGYMLDNYNLDKVIQ